MQFSTLSSLKKTSIPKSLTLLVRLAVLGGMLFFLGLKLWQYEDSLKGMVATIGEGWGEATNAWVVAVLLLVPLNWGLEAKKWQLLAQKVLPATFSASIKAVLTGLSLGLVTPRSLGDYAGRILVHKGSNRQRLVGAVLLNRLLQSLSTYLVGIGGVLILTYSLGLWQSQEVVWLLIPALAGTVLTMLLLGPARKYLIHLLQTKLSQRWTSWITVVQEYTTSELLRLLLWSFARYLVFSFQFLLLLWWTGLEAPTILLLAAVSVTFLLKSLMPAFNFLSDLGVREFSALLVFSLLGLPEAEVVAASLLLWLINICLPALLGGFWVVQLKFQNSKG